MTGSRRVSSRDSGGGQAQIIIMIVGIVFMILAPILAYLIYYAISRKREYLADASSALYTRYPEGLASALEKLAGSTSQLKTANKATAPMYIINPFREKGMKAADLTSTHPPISERIRILRAMAGGASFNNYDQAYRQVHTGGKGILSGAALASAGTMGLRGASSQEPIGEEYKSEKVERTREVNDVMERLNNYEIINCDCGVRLKVPPSFRGRMVRCPHCGRTHQA
jgi:heat shock protein HtpX